MSDQITGVRFANRVWVKTSSQVAATVTDTDPGVASGIYLTRYPLTATPQVTVNGTAQVVVESADTGANPGWQFVYVNNSQQLNYNPALTPLSSSDLVVITYLSPLPMQRWRKTRHQSRSLGYLRKSWTAVQSPVSRNCKPSRQPSFETQHDSATPYAHHARGRIQAGPVGRYQHRGA